MDRTILNPYRIFIRMLERNSNSSGTTLLHRLEVAWSAENMSIILDHFEEGLEKTGWSPHASCDPLALQSMIQWMSECGCLSSISVPEQVSMLPQVHPASATVSGIVHMAQQFQSYTPTALRHLENEARLFSHYLDSPTTMSYAEARAYWG